MRHVGWQSSQSRMLRAWGTGCTILLPERLPKTYRLDPERRTREAHELSELGKDKKSLIATLKAVSALKLCLVPP